MHIFRWNANKRGAGEKTRWHIAEFSPEMFDVWVGLCGVGDGSTESGGLQTQFGWKAVGCKHCEETDPPKKDICKDCLKVYNQKFKQRLK